MKILLTGGSGFIGKNIKEKLSTDFNIKSPSSRELNLLDQISIAQYLKKEKFDVLLHSAAITDVEKEIDEYGILDGNLRMFYNLIQFKDEFSKVFYFGSGAEYDQIHMKPHVTEDSLGKLIPKDPYAFAKFIMSQETKQNDNIYDLILFGVFGKYEAWHRRLISNTICRVLKNMPIVLNQNRFFDYLYIDDLVNIVKQMLTSDLVYHHYNICRGRSIDLLSLIKIIKEVGGNRDEIIVRADGMGIEYSGNNCRMLNEFPGIKFMEEEEAIERLYAYYRSNLNLINEKML